MRLWNKSNLTVMNELSDMFLNFVGKSIVENFCVFVHPGGWSISVLLYLYLLLASGQN